MAGSGSRVAAVSPVRKAAQAGAATATVSRTAALVSTRKIGKKLDLELTKVSATPFTVVPFLMSKLSPFFEKLGTVFALRESIVAVGTPLATERNSDGVGRYPHFGNRCTTRVLRR